MDKSKDIARQMSKIMPVFLRNTYPFVFRNINISPTAMLTIMTIREKGSCTLGELRKEMHVSAPTITGIIDRLVRDGFVVRMPDAKDRRVVKVKLTVKGAKIAAKFSNNIFKRWVHMLKGLPKNMQEGPLIFMQHVIGGLKDEKI